MCKLRKKNLISFKICNDYDTILFLKSKVLCSVWFPDKTNSIQCYMSRLMTKPTKMTVRPAKTQINLGIHPVWLESSLCAQWVAKEPSFLHVDSEDSDQTGRMPRQIWVFAGRTCHCVGFVTRRLNSLIHKGTGKLQFYLKCRSIGKID